MGKIYVLPIWSSPFLSDCSWSCSCSLFRRFNVPRHKIKYQFIHFVFQPSLSAVLVALSSFSGLSHRSINLTTQNKLDSWNNTMINSTRALSELTPIYEYKCSGRTQGLPKRMPGCQALEWKDTCGCFCSVSFTSHIQAEMLCAKYFTMSVIRIFLWLRTLW